MFMVLLFIFLGLAAPVLVLHGVVTLRVNGLRRAGVYPAPGHATMSDVERLVRSGQHILAMRCYREIHHCGVTEAKRAIDTIRTVA